MDRSIPLGSWTAFLTAVAGAIEEIDHLPPDARTTQLVRDRMRWCLENPYENIPAMTLDEERALQIIQLLFDAAVDRFRTSRTF